MKLTTTKVKNTPYDHAGSKIQRIWDGASPGLAFEVFKSGKKSFIYRYRLGGKQKFLTIGDALSIDLQEARDTANDYSRMVREGTDPKFLANSQAGITVSALVDSYKTSAYFKSLSDDYKNNFSTTAKKYIVPTLGDMSANAVKPNHLSLMIESLIGEGKAGAAAGLRTMLSNLFNHAITVHALELDPMASVKVKFPKTKRKERQWLSTDEKLKAAWFIDAPLQVRSLVRWALLTGCRRDEARLTEWESINNGVWSVSDTKGGKPLALPITTMMQAVLDELRPVFAYSDWLFPATTSDSKPIPRASVDYILRESTKAGFSMHVLRHTVESHLAELSIDKESRDLVLNHASGGIGYRYNHSQMLDMKTEALKKWHKKLKVIIS